MTKKNRPVTEFTDEIIAAFRSADFLRLHRALGLSVWMRARCRLRSTASASIRASRRPIRMNCIVVTGSMHKRCRPSCESCRLAELPCGLHEKFAGGHGMARVLSGTC